MQIRGLNRELYIKLLVCAAPNLGECNRLRMYNEVIDQVNNESAFRIIQVIVVTDFHVLEYCHLNNLAFKV